MAAAWQGAMNNIGRAVPAVLFIRLCGCAP